MHAAEALSDLGRGQEVIRELEADFSHVPNVTHRVGLAREWVRAGDDSKVRVLVAELADLNSAGRIHAAESLWKLGRVGDEQVLIQAARHSDNLSLRIYASAAYLRSSDEPAREIDTIVDGLMDSHSIDCVRAAFVLGRIDYPEAAEVLRKHIDPLSKDSLEYAFGLMSIGLQSGFLSAGDVMLLAEHEIPGVRAQFAHILPELLIPSGDLVLQKLLFDEDLDVRIRASHTVLKNSKR